MAIRSVRDPRRPFEGARRLAPFAAILLAASLAGCGVNRIVADGDRGSDARLRHPIALVEQPYTVDLFPTGVQLDDRTRQQVVAFAQRYRQVGRGSIAMLVPRAAQRELADGRVLDQIRRELAASGAVAPVAVSHYPIQNPGLASPVRLSFDGLKAAVTHRCGDWPSDLASASSTSGWENKTYWNFGCSSQAMLAAQVADPRDVATPQGETPPDGGMRMRAIGNVRRGVDPATTWITKNSNIGSVGN